MFHEGIVIRNLVKKFSPDAVHAIDIARQFSEHNNCVVTYPTNEGTIGVLQRTDGATLTLWLLRDENAKNTENSITGWAYAVYQDNTSYDEILTTGGSNGDGGCDTEWENIVRNITSTVTNWLDAAPIPDPLSYQREAMERAKDMLVDKLARMLNFVDTTCDDKDNLCAQIYLSDAALDCGDDAPGHAIVRISAVSDCYEIVFPGHDIPVIQCATFDGLIEELEERGAQPCA